ncbi:L-asparaginase [Citrobacter sp. FDAARGOS_156]|nr:L-asparaginase [Citrobacter sp. FDAARGOS_156]
MNPGCARHPHVLRVCTGRQARSVSNLTAPITLENKR